MTTYKQYLPLEKSIIAGVIDENEKLLGFTVCDRNMERLVVDLFQNASLAIQWSNSYFNETGDCYCGKVGKTKLYGKWWCDNCRIEVI